MPQPSSSRKDRERPQQRQAKAPSRTMSSLAVGGVAGGLDRGAGRIGKGNDEAEEIRRCLLPMSDPLG